MKLDGFDDDDFLPVPPGTDETVEDDESEEETAEPEEETSVADGNAVDINESETEQRKIKEIDIPDFSESNRRGFGIKGLIWIIFILIVCLFVYLFSSSESSYIKNYKTNFVMNIRAIDSKFGISRSINEFFGRNTEDDRLKKREENKAAGTKYDNESYLLPFENASISEYAASNGGVIAAKSNYIAFLDNMGKIKWELSTSVVNPILCVEGKYIMIAETGGTKICLYNGNKLIYAADAQNKILNAGISSGGDVVVVTEKEFYKGAIEVFNKKGDRIYSWSSGSETIICADISPSSRKIAVGFLDASGQAKGSVQLFDIKQESSYKTIEIPDTVVCRLEFCGETLNVFGDNRITGITIHGNIAWDKNYGTSPLLAFSIDSKGNKISLIEQDNAPVIKLYSRSGNEKASFPVEEIPDYIDVSGERMLYNNTRMVIYGKEGRMNKYAATMDIKKLKIIDAETFLIVYSNSIEFVKV